jgi:hypothetical protein
MNLKIHNVEKQTENWLRLHNCIITSAEDADFIIYENVGDNIPVDRLFLQYGTDKLVFILSGDTQHVKHLGKWLVNNTDLHNHQIWMSNPRVQKQTYKFNCTRKFIGSFKGTIWQTPSRQILNKLYELQGWNIINYDYWNTVTNKQNQYNEMISLTKESVFTLCPKGNGKSSMRIVEAMSVGSIPILIDDDTNPFDGEFNNLCIRLSSNNVEDFAKKVIPENYKHQMYKCFCYFNDVIYRDYKYNLQNWTVCSGFSYKIIDILKQWKLKQGV